MTASASVCQQVCVLCVTDDCVFVFQVCATDEKKAASELSFCCMRSERGKRMHKSRDMLMCSSAER